MQVIRAVGREAAAKKYDILSAMAALALSAEPHRQRQILRLMALITTRYNWQRNELAVGQREIARLWCVDERTVKREMARLKAQGWVTVKRQGARGRVSVLSLELERIVIETRPVWANIGEDYVARMAGPEAAGQGTADDKVVPFRRPDTGGGSVWDRARAALEASDSALAHAWLHPLAEAGIEDGCLVLLAPSRFHATYLRTHLQARLAVAVARVDPSVTRLRIEAP